MNDPKLEELLTKGLEAAQRPDFWDFKLDKPTIEILSEPCESCGA